MDNDKIVQSAFTDYIIGTINEGEFVFNVEELIHYTAFVVQSHSYQSLTAIYFAARAPPQSLI